MIKCGNSSIKTNTFYFFNSWNQHLLHKIKNVKLWHKLKTISNFLWFINLLILFVLMIFLLLQIYLHLAQQQTHIQKFVIKYLKQKFYNDADILVMTVMLGKQILSKSYKKCKIASILFIILYFPLDIISLWTKK